MLYCYNSWYLKYPIIKKPIQLKNNINQHENIPILIPEVLPKKITMAEYYKLVDDKSS